MSKPKAQPVSEAQQLLAELEALQAEAAAVRQGCSDLEDKANATYHEFEALQKQLHAKNREASDVLDVNALKQRQVKAKLAKEAGLPQENCCMTTAPDRAAYSELRDLVGRSINR